MKHKILKFISIILIAAMAGQPAADASDALRPRAAGEREGAGEEFDAAAFLSDFKHKKMFRWEKVPPEYLRDGILTVLRELASVLGKRDVSELTAYDLGRKAIMGDDGCPRTLRALVSFIARRANIRVIDAVEEIEWITGISLWKYEDWMAVSRILGMETTGNRETVIAFITEKWPALNLRQGYVTIPLSVGQEYALLEEIVRGNRAAYEALFLAYHRYLYKWVDIGANNGRMKLDPTALMNACENALGQAALYFDRAQGKNFGDFLRTYYLHNLTSKYVQRQIELGEVRPPDGQAIERKRIFRRRPPADDDRLELCLDRDVDKGWLEAVIRTAFSQLRAAGNNGANEINEDVYCRRIFGGMSRDAIAHQGIGVDLSRREVVSPPSISYRFNAANRAIYPYLDAIYDAARQTHNPSALNNLQRIIRAIEPRGTFSPPRIHWRAGKGAHYRAVSSCI